MAETNFPDITAYLDCPIEGCDGTIIMEFQPQTETCPTGQKLVCTLVPSGLTLAGEHCGDHPEMWMRSSVTSIPLT